MLPFPIKTVGNKYKFFHHYSQPNVNCFIYLYERSEFTENFEKSLYRLLKGVYNLILITCKKFLKGGII